MMFYSTQCSVLFRSLMLGSRHKLLALSAHSTTLTKRSIFQTTILVECLPLKTMLNNFVVRLLYEVHNMTLTLPAYNQTFVRVMVNRGGTRVINSTILYYRNYTDNQNFTTRTLKVLSVWPQNPNETTWEEEFTDLNPGFLYQCILSVTSFNRTTNSSYFWRTCWCTFVTDFGFLKKYLFSFC